jgi:ferredoxin
VSSIFFDAFRRLSQSQLSEITVEQERCIDIHRKEKQICTACQKNCVADAVRIGEQIVIDWNKCVRCGVCAAVCPTEVFTMQVFSDNMILKEIASQPKNEPLLIECNVVNGQFEGKEKHARNKTKGKKIVVSCIARFSETFLLQIIIAGGDNLEFAKCTADCSFKAGREVIKEMQRRTDMLLERFDVTEHKDESVKDKIISERRLLLSEVGLQAIRMVLPRNTPDTKQLNSKDKVPMHRAGLIELVKKQSPKGQFNRENMPFGNVTADLEKCQFHGHCAEACPTGAIRLVDTTSQGKELVFLYGACVGCGACLDACPEGALDLDETVDLTHLSSPWATLTARQYRLCTSCGRQFSVKSGSDSQVCSDCEKRWAQIEKYADESAS